MSAIAFLLCLSAAVCVYLASPQQRLLPSRNRSRLRPLAVSLAPAGTGVWMYAADVASGLVAAMLVLMLSSVALPYLALLLPAREAR
ncbi:hypothetical protein R0381_001030 [Jeongeupia wiesaeckerbachi]|uniref:hypothetical protein n=1 Tax=Jeongeupia wiesaeckerbachi TaxID=3051218 RepID=UPI003D807188